MVWPTCSANGQETGVGSYKCQSPLSQLEGEGDREGEKEKEGRTWCETQALGKGDLKGRLAGQRDRADRQDR